MGSVSSSTRRDLLTRGWYVVQDVETAFLGLSGRAHDVLIIIKHLQGSNAEAVPAQQRIADVMHCSVRTVQRALDELASKGAITRQRTGRASRYRVRYCLGTVAEIRVLLGGDITIPDELADTTTCVVSDATDPDGPPLYKEPPKNNYNYPLPSGGGDAGAPHTETGLGDEMSLRKNTPPVDELDPADALGLWQPQESPQTGSDGLEALFPDEEVTQPPTARQKPARSRAQRDAAGALAHEFASLVRQQPWAGPSPVNVAALARNLSTWKKDGLTAVQIRAMMERYVAPDFPRRPARAPWIDFLGQRHKLLALGQRAQTAHAMEEHRNDEAYWLGSMAASR